MFTWYFGSTEDDLAYQDLEDLGKLDPPQHILLDFRDEASRGRFERELAAYFPNPEYPVCTGRNRELFRDIFGDWIYENWESRLHVEVLLRNSQVLSDPQLMISIASSFEYALDSALYGLIRTDKIGSNDLSAYFTSRFKLSIYVFDG